MPLFNAAELATLALVCDTFVPGDDAADAASPNTHHAFIRTLRDALVEALERVTDETDRAGLRLFLNTIEHSAANRISAGIGRPFTTMSRAERERLLLAWAASPVPQARQLFQSLKRLTLFLAYSILPDGKTNPAFDRIGYALPERTVSSAERPLRPLDICQPTTLSCDVVIVGSGAGGGVVAAELSAAGYDVIVVEKGGYYHGAEFHGRELESTEQLFEKYGSFTTRDKSMIVLAGSTLGGGTTVNWAASFRTPDDVREEWARDYGFTGAVSAEFTASLDAVCQRLNVNADTPDSPQNSRLAEGCRVLGYEVGTIARNVKGCDADERGQRCGFCNFGCAFSAKQGTLHTYLQDAAACGTRLIVRGYTERVWIERGQAKGVEVSVTDSAGRRHPVTIRSKAVVVAAGALHTPALLRRSGLGSAHIGANLHLHPTSVIYGLFDQPIRGWEGAPMTRISRQFASLDGRGYGVRLETAPVHPGIAALSLPWQSGAQHRESMRQLAYLGNIIIITRDRYGGQVTTDRNGSPVVNYRLHPTDAAHLMRGVIEALRVHHAAGALELCSPHALPQRWRAGAASADLETYLERVRASGLKPNAFSLYSAHQMSSARIGGSTALGALTPHGESYEVRNLFVTDASALPTATGVNPMISIMATAHYLAQGLKTRL